MCIRDSFKYTSLLKVNCSVNYISFLPASGQRKSRKPLSRFPARWERLRSVSYTHLVPLKVGKIRQRISCRLAFNSQFRKQFDSALTCFGTCQGIGDCVFWNTLFQKRRSNSFIMCKIVASDSITLIYDKQTART